MKLITQLKTAFLFVCMINITTCNLNKEIAANNKFKLSIKDNNLIAEIHDPNIYIKSINIGNLEKSGGVYSQTVYSSDHTLTIENYRSHGIQEQKPYTFLMFQEDPNAPSKVIDGVYFCYKGDKILQFNSEPNLPLMQSSCRAI